MGSTELPGTKGSSIKNKRIVFCRDTALAARKLGIVMIECTNNFIFFDISVGSTIPGRASKDRKIAFFNACVALVRYLSKSKK